MLFVSRIGLLLVALLAAAPSHANQLIFTAVLTGANENPANASGGNGTAIITFDLDLVTMRLQTVFAELSGNAAAAHIHCCTSPPGNIGVATQTPSFTGFPLGGTFGAYDNTFDMTQASSYNASFITGNGGTVSSAFTALLNGATAGKAYLNIHSSFAPGGEIRGFLVPVVVPEPSTYNMMLGGLFALGTLARRRQLS
jgi:hypothetical protein